MKRIFTAMIAAVCFACLFSLALAEGFSLSEREAIQGLKDNLTEVYGYTVEEANAFVIETEWAEGDGVWLVEGWPAAHPDWVYTCVIDGRTGGFERVESPFAPNPGWVYYRGEGAFREIFRRIEKERLLEGEWIPKGKEVLTWLRDMNLRASSDLYQQLSNMEATPGAFIHELFCGNYGDPVLWRKATREWHDELMKKYGAIPEAHSGFFPLGQAGDYEIKKYGTSIVVQKFNEELPEQLNFLKENRQLADQRLVCGIAIAEQNEEASYAAQKMVCVFENAVGERILIYGQMDNQTRKWKTVNMGGICLPAGKPLDLAYNDVSPLIRIQMTEDVRVSMTIIPNAQEGLLEAMCGEIHVVNRSTGEVIFAANRSDGLALNLMYADQWESIDLSARLSSSLAWLDTDRLPLDGKGWKSYIGTPLPENMGVTAGAHLRKDHSSHSMDLGIPYAGVTMEILGSVPGTEAPWYQVRIGSKEGWMSSNYVRTGTASDAPLLAQARREIQLKNGLGLFAGKAAVLPAGTRMYVIQEEKGNYYVCVPAGELVWPMQVEGTYGYVSKKDVDLAWTPAELDW